MKSKVLTSIARRVGVSLAASGLIMTGLVWAGANQIHHNADLPAPVGSPRWYMEHCNPVPQGEFPARVIMFRQGSGFVESTDNPRLLHQALEQALNGKQFGHEIVGFCS